MIKKEYPIRKVYKHCNLELLYNQMLPYLPKACKIETGFKTVYKYHVNKVLYLLLKGKSKTEIVLALHLSDYTYQKALQCIDSAIAEFAYSRFILQKSIDFFMPRLNLALETC